MLWQLKRIAPKTNKQKYTVNTHSTNTKPSFRFRLQTPKDLLPSYSVLEALVISPPHVAIQRCNCGPAVSIHFDFEEAATCPHPPPHFLLYLFIFHGTYTLPIYRIIHLKKVITIVIWFCIILLFFFPLSRGGNVNLMEQGVFFNWTLAAVAWGQGWESWAWFWGQGVYSGLRAEMRRLPLLLYLLTVPLFTKSFKCHGLKSQVMGVKGEAAWAVRI